ncbi:MAG TPA: ABC transporter permease subunit [Chloroflexota bacterium]|nr:ABC transporter permease subunit [Chloroflexota bacterium]
MGIIPIFRKELADHLGSRRFAILFALIVLAGVSASYVAAQSIQADLAQHPDQSFVFLRLFTASSGSLPPFVSFVAFLGPLLGVAFGFDAINSELARGTLGRLLSQPIFRDDVINGKFLAGLAVISVTILCIFFVVGGLGLRMIGVPPTGDEMIRLLFFFFISVIYVGFWLALSMLFSLLTRQVATSALAALAVWLFMAIFVSIVSGLIAGAIYPVTNSSPVQQQLDHATLQGNISRISPANLYSEATEAILTPDLRTTGPVLLSEAQGMVPGALSLNQSLLLVWPDLTATIALTVICFGAAYATFLRQEVRTL